MKKALLTILLVSLCCISWAATRHIGSGQTYATLSAAAAVAQPGDTLLMHEGIYAGGLFISNLKGNASQWITIKNVAGETVVFEGGSNAIHFVEPEYLHLIGLIFQHQTGNGLNTDDGGTYDTPAHHIIFENCIFRDMSASGNNDLLKLSGLDFFEVRNCEFLNGAGGGSGIDMVGCHYGIILGNHFEQMGSNAIQCKGGSEQVRIEGNFFRNCGQRTLNIGGSTGLQFFRPDTAHFEAANIQVYSNIFIGSVAPIAYVGAVNVEVVNNTIYKPEKWVVRILQETVDPDRFLECGDNSFRNNLVFIDNNVSIETNIGPNTRPETFDYSHNLWFNSDNTNWSGPNIPVPDLNQILNADPLLFDPVNSDFSIPPNSPAAGAGMVLGDPKLDFMQHAFADPPSIGALEANPVSELEPSIRAESLKFNVFPNPATDFLWVNFEGKIREKVFIELYDLRGVLLASQAVVGHSAPMFVSFQDVPGGVYFLKINLAGKTAYGQLVLVK